RRARRLASRRSIWCSFACSSKTSRACCARWTACRARSWQVSKSTNTEDTDTNGDTVSRKGLRGSPSIFSVNSVLAFLRDEVSHNRSLFFNQLFDAVIGEIEERVERIAVERLSLSSPLNLDEPSLAGLDDVHVHFGP